MCTAPLLIPCPSSLSATVPWSCHSLFPVLAIPLPAPKMIPVLSSPPRSAHQSQSRPGQMERAGAAEIPTLISLVAEQQEDHAEV